MNTSTYLLDGSVSLNNSVTILGPFKDISSYSQMPHMWLNCSIWSQFAAHFSSFHHKRATQIQSRCLRHLFSVKWNILTLWLWVVGFMNYTIIIKCSGNSFLWRIASLRRCGGTLNGKMCCFLLMTTRNEKCVVFNVSWLVLPSAPVNRHMSMLSRGLEVSGNTA